MSENKIVLKNEHFTADEDGEAGGAVTPGHLVELDSNGEYVAHSTAGDAAEPVRFARKAGEIGDEITDAYADGDWIKVANCLPTVEVYAHLASGENVAYGAKLVSNGNGELRELDTGGGDTDAAIAIAREAVDATGGAERITVEVV